MNGFVMPTCWVRALSFTTIKTCLISNIIVRKLTYFTCVFNFHDE